MDYLVSVDGKEISFSNAKVEYRDGILHVTNLCNSNLNAMFRKWDYVMSMDETDKIKLGYKP